jgi:DNA topoisomerase-3
LLDDLVVGKQDIISAIDAVCDVAKRIIRKFKQGTNGDGPPLIKPSRTQNAGGLPPTAKMISFANSLAKQKGIKQPPGYTKLSSVCRRFLDTYAPKKTGT